MILCDTNILIELFRDNRAVRDELQKIGLDNLAVSVVTTAEIYYGARDKTELAKIKKRLSLLHTRHPTTYPRLRTFSAQHSPLS